MSSVALYTFRETHGIEDFLVGYPSNSDGQDFLRDNVLFSKEGKKKNSYSGLEGAGFS